VKTDLRWRGTYPTYAVAAAASLALSLGGAWAVTIPNPDAALYLRSAELIQAGRWGEALQVYGWPTYSALIAALMRVSGCGALAAALALNAVFAVVTTLAFIGLVQRLADADRTVVACAALVILLQPQLTQLRTTIVRDNGYLAFFVLSLYWVAADLAAPRRCAKLAIACSILAAGLFRIEGFFLAVWIPAFYVTRQPGGWRRPPVLAAALAVVLLAMPGVMLWSGGALGQWLAGQGALGGPVHHWRDLLDSIQWRVGRLKSEVLFPYGGGNAWSAYVGMAIGIVVINVARAMSVPLALLTPFAFVPKRLVPRQVAAFVLWFGSGQLLVLFVFTFVNMLLDKRYAVGLALLFDIPLAFLLAGMVRALRSGSPASTLSSRVLPVLVGAVFVAVFAFALPRPSKLEYLRQAGLWVGQEVGPGDRVITNDSRIAYYSGRPYGDSMRMWTYGFHPAPSPAELDGFDYLVLQARDPAELPALIQALPGKQVVRTFEGKDGGQVIVYHREHAAR